MIMVDLPLKDTLVQADPQQGCLRPQYSVMKFAQKHWWWSFPASLLIGVACARLTVSRLQEVAISNGPSTALVTNIVLHESGPLEAGDSLDGVNDIIEFIDVFESSINDAATRSSFLTRDQLKKELLPAVLAAKSELTKHIKKPLKDNKTLRESCGKAGSEFEGLNSRFGRLISKQSWKPKLIFSREFCEQLAIKLKESLPKLETRVAELSLVLQDTAGHGESGARLVGQRTRDACIQSRRAWFYFMLGSLHGVDFTDQSYVGKDNVLTVRQIQQYAELQHLLTLHSKEAADVCVATEYAYVTDVYRKNNQLREETIGNVLKGKYWNVFSSLLSSN